jgi:hypothetical protein
LYSKKKGTKGDESLVFLPAARTSFMNEARISLAVPCQFENEAITICRLCPPSSLTQPADLCMKLRG